MTVQAYPIPDAALANHIAILGKTGSGKTYAAKGVAERLLAAGSRLCVVDPTGAWWGLKSSATGKSGAFPVVVFGGTHSDLPLGGAHGKAIAEVVGTSSTPSTIDTSQMTVGERTRFFTDFATELLRKNSGPLHLVIDEAHLFAPQAGARGGKDVQSNEMLHAANNLVSLGRSRGLRIILITQRPAKLHKDSLTQVETLVAMRVLAPQDREAIEAWIKDNADKERGKEIISSLATLKTGEAWIWAPEFGVLDRVRFPTIKTFDTSKAPTGEGDGKGPVLAPIDRDAIAKRLEAVAADVLANDPKALKAEIARLQRELRQVSSGPDAAAIKEAERRGYDAGMETGKTQAVQALAKFASNMAGSVGRAKAACEDAQRLLDSFATFAETQAGARAAPVARPLPQPIPKMEPKRQSATRTNGGTAPSSDMGAERKPLAVLASVAPAGLTEAQWAVAAGMKRTGGTWAAYKSRLRTAGRIEQRGGLWFATDQGLDDLGQNFEPMPPPGSELVEYWASRVSGAGPMLRYLSSIYPRSVSREELAAALDMTASGGTFAAYLSRLRSPGLIEQDGNRNMRAAPALMEG